MRLTGSPFSVFCVGCAASVTTHSVQTDASSGRRKSQAAIGAVSNCTLDMSAPLPPSSII